MNLLNSFSIGTNNTKTIDFKNPIVLKSYPENHIPSVKEERVHITVSGDKQSGFTFFHDNLNWFDDEQLYTFKPDGSAYIMSPAWGTKTEFPKGTFSELYATLPEKPEDFDFELAQKLIKSNKDKAIKYTDATQLAKVLNVQKN